MLVSVGESCVLVKIAGKVNFVSSIDFKTLFDELWRKGCVAFVVDLGECIMMDSTFLGVLAGFGLKANTPQPDGISRTLTLVNPSDRIVELLENLGVLSLFTVVQGDVVMPEQTENRKFTAANPSQEELKRTCLEAHQALMRAHSPNVDRFKDVAAFLAEDLKKLKAGV
jgi:anti-sigma B factor antagonist